MAGASADAEFQLCETCDRVYLLTGKPHVCGAVVKAQEQPGAFNSCLRKIYYPFLLRFALHGVYVPKTKYTPRFMIPWLGIAWLALFAVCVAFGPNFLSNTRSGLDVPPGTPTAKALDAMNANYPEASSWPPAIVLHHVKTGVPGTIIVNNTLRVSTTLAQFQAQHSDIIQGVSGYFELMQANLPLLADITLSKDKRSMISSIMIKKGADLKAVTEMVKKLLELVHGIDYPDIHVGLTGIFPLFGEMTEATETNFAMIDGISLPVCVIILGLNLRSYKHMGIALVNLVVSLILSFAILLPISNVVDINPFAPSIMMSLGIAVCFDYSLFMLNRFREAVILEGLETDQALLSALQTAGHVIVLSGTTLLATFLLLLIFPQNFLQSVGWACSSVVLSAIIVNMSVTPCLLLACKCLTTFEALPPCMTPKDDSNNCCCKPRRRSATNFPLDDIVPEPPTKTDSSSPLPSADVSTQPTLESSSPIPSEPPTPSSSSFSSSVPTTTTAVASSSSSSSSSSSVVSPPLIDVAPAPKKFRRSCWFRLSFAVTKHPWLAFLCSLAVMAVFVYRWEGMVVTSDDTILFLQGSNTLNTLIQMREDFDEGMLDPFSMILIPKSGLPNSVLTQEYFTAESSLLNTILTEQAHYVTASSFTALTLFAARNVTFPEAMGYFTAGSPTYNTSTAASYRLSVGGLLNTKRSATLIRISTTVHPKSQLIIPFIDGVRAELDEIDNNGPITAYLFGAYSSDYDVQNALYALTPYLYASTIAIVLIIVGASFHSVLIAVRLAITIIMSLSWTYGLMTLVYQPGPTQTAFAYIGPSLTQSTGTYWIIPIMSFSILVGLALDYDIFLMSRVVEFRRAGWSDRAAICLAVEKTGGIITAAGVIMAVSFAGLLFPDTMALNQYGFSLSIGVTLDTFVVRTILVPAVFTAFSTLPGANWWPGKMPPPVLDAKTELEVLMAGYWHPPEKWPRM